MRYLCLDLGDKRTGLAMGDDLVRVVSPLRVLDVPRGPQLLAAIIRVIDDQRPAAIVIGLPLNMDGTEGPAATFVREFGSELATKCTLSIHYQDERLTSAAAEQHLNQSGRTRGQKKKLRDALAAAEILNDFFESRT